MRLILMGPPGSGKGTQGVRLSAELGIPAISTGDIFRANVAAGTALGLEARRYMDAGEYVPDEVTNSMVRDRLAQPDCEAGFLLDGYPRTINQISVLDAIFDDAGWSLDGVIRLAVDRDVLVSRLLARAQHEGRADDTEDVIRRRQDVYVEQTAPLTGEYRYRGLLLKVDGDGSVDAVARRIRDVLVSAGRWNTQKDAGVIAPTITPASA